MKKLIITAVTVLSLGSSASANDLLKFLEVAHEVSNAINGPTRPNMPNPGFHAEPEPHPGFRPYEPEQPNMPNPNFRPGGYRPSNVDGGRTSHPFTRIERDVRGQRWKVTGVRYQRGGEFREEIRSRVRLRNGVRHETGSSSVTPRFDDSGNVYFDHTTEQTKILDSASDVYRNHVDPGSKRYINRVERDPYTGAQIRVTGWVWTSYGKPHTELKRTKITQDFNGNTNTEVINLVGSGSPTP